MMTEMDPLHQLLNGSSVTKITHIVVKSLKACVKDAFASVDSNKILSLSDFEYSVNEGIPKNKFVIYSGSFSPYHVGHHAMLSKGVQFMSKISGTRFKPLVEISVNNVEKSKVTDSSTILNRVVPILYGTPATSQYVPELTQIIESANLDKPFTSVVITSVPRFIEKAALFPSNPLLVGFDTAKRILDPKYYKSEEDMVNTLKTFYDLESVFLVAGRYDSSQDSYYSLKDLSMSIPTDLADLFIELPDFRVDISSTEIRELASTSTAA